MQLDIEDMEDVVDARRKAMQTTGMSTADLVELGRKSDETTYQQRARQGKPSTDQSK
jgi:hypothetical protein